MSKGTFTKLFTRAARKVGFIKASAPAKQGTFTIVAYTGGKLNIDGFAQPVVVDLAGLEASGNIPIAIKHDTDDSMILGQTADNGVTNDGRQLTLRGPITADPDESPTVKRVLSMAARGHKWQASIGAHIEEERAVLAGESVHVNGRTLEGPFTLATKSVLRETSVLAMGADKRTSFTLSASAVCNLTADGEEPGGQATTQGDNPDFETWLKDDLGLDPASLTEKARQALIQQYAVKTKDPNDELDAEGNPVVPDACPSEPPSGKKGNPMAASGSTTTGNTNVDTMLQAQRNKYADEARRVTAIEAKCGKDRTLCAAAIEQGWTVDKAELEYMRRRLATPPAGHIKTSSPQGTLQALQGAMILRAKGKLDNPEYSGELGLALGLPAWLRANLNADVRQQVMEAAWKFREMSMIDLCKAAVQIDGENSRHLDGSNVGWIRAAVSGGALADIFTTNINALLIQKFTEHPDTTGSWTREADVNNFLLQERTRLVKGPRLTLHGRGGEADHATRSDVMNSYKISRFSQQFKVDEMDIIDDRFKALEDIPNEMGMACVRLRPDLVYAILMSNPNITKEDGSSGALFSASQPNSQTNYVSSGAALGSQTLQTAMGTMFSQQENKVGIDATPTHLIVPPVLIGTAATLLQSPTIVVAGTSGAVTTKGTMNEIDAMQKAWGLVTPVSDQRLHNGVTDPVSGTSYAGSDTKWYLVSNKVPTIEVAYLRGAGRAPQVRQYVIDKGAWGIGWDCNLDIGAKALAWHGMYAANA